MDELRDLILVEIFLRIPVKCVFRFRLVSKRWNNVLSDPLFCSKYQCRLKEAASNSKQQSNYLPILGFFHGLRLGRRTERDYGMPLLTFLPTCTEGFPLRSRYFMNAVGYILGISNGLILCGHNDPMSFYVCNPVTNQWFSLPQPNYKPSTIFPRAILGFSYEEFHDFNKGSTRCAFTVVRANLEDYTPKNTLSIETYSSETGLWKESLLTAAAPFYPIWRCTAIRGIFYFTTNNFVAAYDPNTSEDQLWLMLSPIFEDARPILAETPDGLLQCGLKVLHGFQISCLRKNLHCYTFSETIPPHEWVPLYSFHDPIPPILGLNRLLIANGWEHPTAELYPSVTAFHPQNSKIVYFRFNHQIFQCDWERAIIQVVPHVGLNFLWTKFYLYPYLEPEWPPSPFPSFKFQLGNQV